MALYCASSSYRVAALSPTSCSRNTQRNIPLSRMTTQTAGSSSFLATAAAAVLLCSSLFAPSALAADFAAPGSVDLQPPPSRAEGLARSRTAAPSPPPPPPTVELLSGSVRVSDGDTVEITSEADGTRHMVRIWGIDAPETKQLCRDGAGRDYACGKKATERMRELLGETATCEIRARDQYGRAVARCFPGSRTEEDIISEGEGESGDAGLALIESGDAVAYRQFSKGFYEPAEEVAREQKVGLWGGEVEEPADWRRARRIETLQGVAARRAPSPGGPLALAPKPSLPLPLSPQSPQTPQTPQTPSPAAREKAKDDKKAGCDIKGNISSGNAKRYHLPGTVFYDSVKVDEAKGERFFCSEEEAVAAGWEKAKYGDRPPKKEKEKAGSESSDEGGAAAAAAAAAPSTDAEVQAEGARE